MINSNKQVIQNSFQTAGAGVEKSWPGPGETHKTTSNFKSF